VKGEPVQFQDTMDALRAGISMIHQELNLVPHMTVAENIWLGREPMKYGFVDHRQLARQTQTLLNKLNIRLSADRLVGELSIAAQQMVEIAKAVSWNADIVIMDEPTSALTESEVAHLFTIIRDLREQGKAIIYISHKMDEIFAITDEISVFRDGTWVGSRQTGEFTRQSLITQMVGRELTQLFPKFNNTIGEEVLTVRNLSRKGYFEGVNFSVRRGEILGVAGLVGAGICVVMICGLTNGFLVTRTGIPPFIATLGMMVSARGLAQYYTQGNPISFLSDSFTSIGQGAMPVIIFFVIAALFHIALKHTRYGKYVYAIGGNMTSAKVSGINVNKYLVIVYTIAGALSGLAGVVLAARVSSGQSSMGMSYELDAIAAAVIGGSSLMGGVGRITGTLIGAMILGLIKSGFTFVGVDAYVQDIIKGIIIVAAVTIDMRRNRKKH
jgi:ribose/xylose/arabinose/galactoside ABC-type transport system permease subunit/ABC-type polar amino acid transport system ATPase subunit